MAQLELPGIPRSNIHITMKDTYLIVYGSRLPDTYSPNAQTQVIEFKYGQFQRVLKIPANLSPSSIKAIADNGVLTISWPCTAPISQQQQSSHEADAVSP